MESLAKPGLTIKLIRELFDYDPETGHITRKISYGRAIAGQIFNEAHGEFAWIK